MKKEDLLHLTNEEIRGVLNGTEKTFPKVIDEYVFTDKPFIGNTISTDKYGRLRRVNVLLELIIIERFRNGLIN